MSFRRDGTKEGETAERGKGAGHARLNSSLFVQSTFQPGADIFLESPPVRKSRRVSCLDYPTDAPPGGSDSEFSKGENGPGGVARVETRRCNVEAGEGPPGGATMLTERRGGERARKRKRERANEKGQEEF